MSLSAPPAQAENPLAPNFNEPDPRNHAKSPEVASRAFDLVHEAMAAARDARGVIMSQWQKNADAFFNIRHRKAFRGRANVIDPEPFRVIETIYARIAKALLASKPWMRGSPGPGEVMADQKQAFLNEALLQQQLSVGSDGKRMLKSNIKSWLILGTSAVKVQWDVETRRRKVRDRRTGKMGKVGDAFVWQGPRWRDVDLDELYFANPLEGETPDEQDYVIERKIVNLSDLRANARRGALVNVESIKAEDVLPRENAEESLKMDRAQLVGIEHDQASPRKRPVGKVELWMYEGPFDLYGNEDEIECWIWIANGRHVLRVQENPYWHGKRSYATAPCIRVPGNIYGISPVQHILDLWTELNDLHNMGLDSATLSLNPALMVGASAGINYKQWLLRPGAILPMNDINAVREFEFTPMTQVAHEAMGPLRQMMRETSSATSLLQAEQTGGIDKATIYAGSINESNTRIAMNADDYADMLECAADKAWGLNQQFIQKDQLVRILGKGGYEWVPVRPQDIKYPMDWEAVNVSNIGAELTRNMGLERFMASMTPLALQGVVRLDFHEIAKTYWTSLGMVDPDRIIAPQGPQPMDPKQENLMLSQRQPVDPHPQEDFATHRREHMLELERLEGQPAVDEIAVGMLIQHIQETDALFRKVEEAKAAAAQMAVQQSIAAAQGPNGGRQTAGAPALGNQAAFGPQIGAAKEGGERLSGRQG